MQLLTIHLLMPSQLPSSGCCPVANSPQFHMLSMTSYGMDYRFGQFGSAVLAVSHATFLYTYSPCWQSSMGS